jgi:hypothetical protein
MTPILQSTLTCPDCSTQSVETMPTNACVYFHTCVGCGMRLKPKPGDCCVFCSFGSVPCPPIQEGGKDACCAIAPESAGPSYCSLEPGAFGQRIGEIAALVHAFGGIVERMPGGAALCFKAQDGLRTALDTLAEKERSCCATLEFTVVEQTETISFRISGPDGDRAAIDDLLARLGTAHVAAELRPDVHRPDWSKVTLLKARDVLQRRLAAHPAGVARWEGLDAGEDKALVATLGHFIRHGRAPSREAIADATGQSPNEVRSALESLRMRDLVVLDQFGASIRAAYPFAAYSTGHRITLSGQAIDSLCAIDALGAGAMCGTESSIESKCAQCGVPIHITTSRGGLELEAVEPASAVVWYSLAFDGYVAQSCCPSTLFFCSDDHLTAWCAGNSARTTGDRLEMDEALEIGIALFEPLLRASPERRAAGTIAERVDASGGRG